MRIEEFLDSFESDAQSVITLVASSDLDLQVPPCPGWQLRDLAVHLGTVHRWAKACIEANGPLPLVESPIEDSMLIPWLNEGLTELSELLRATPPHRETWTFGPQPQVMSFWCRRQAQEAAVHLWDAQSALGIAEPIEETLAADGVAEVFEVFIPRQLGRGRMQLPNEGIRIVLTDGRTFDIGEKISGEVSGSASDILLALWHRVPATSLVTDADERVVEAAFARAFTS
jgi:uncharacterized protein (TIGR03083 family)